MAAISQKQINNIELLSLFFNNIFLLLGIAFFNFTLFDTLFLYWLELPVAAGLNIYFYAIAPLKYGHPDTYLDKQYRKKAGFSFIAFLGTCIGHFLMLILILYVSNISKLSIDQGIWQSMSQIPAHLYEADMLWVAILLVVAYILPVWLVGRQNRPIILINMPLQVQIMIHPFQFMVGYLLFGLVALTYYYTPNPLIIILPMILIKSLIEYGLFRRITSRR
ncbi:MAG: hypothetical protein MK212_16575 [Saprospiraceae bacterium]|nr:hypothetical protein [Saprospiraceae bacterium]